MTTDDASRILPADTCRVVFESSIGRPNSPMAAFTLLLRHASMQDVASAGEGAEPANVEELHLAFDGANAYELTRDLIEGVAGIVPTQVFDTYAALIRRVLVDAARSLHGGTSA